MRYVKPMLRLTVFLVVCGAVLAYVDYRSARASVMEHLLGIGSRMAPYLDDARSTEGPRQVRINGIKLFVAAGHTEQPPSFVRKWYMDRYAGKGDGMDALSQDLKKRNLLPPDMQALNELSFGNDKRGGMAALDFGGEKLSMDGFRKRVETFVKSGDLSDLAKMRYVYYEANGQGGTRFLTVWTDEHLLLDKLMPADGDAPGADLPDVPRYPGTVRVLSAEEHGMPQRVVVYDGPGSPETAELFYRGRMPTLGWSADESFSRLAKKQGKTSLRFDNKKGHEVVLDLSSTDRQQGLTVVAVQTR